MTSAPRSTSGLLIAAGPSIETSTTHRPDSGAPPLTRETYHPARKGRGWGRGGGKAVQGLPISGDNGRRPVEILCTAEKVGSCFAKGLARVPSTAQHQGVTGDGDRAEGDLGKCR